VRVVLPVYQQLGRLPQGHAAVVRRTVTMGPYRTLEQAGVGQFMAIQFVSTKAGKAAGTELIREIRPVVMWRGR
jgi:hypothetical protein